MLNPDEILNLFLFIEKKFDITRFTYKGINFWPLIRSNIGLDLYSNPTIYNLKRKKRSLAEMIKLPYRNIKLKKAKANYIKTLKPLQSDYIICTYPNSLFTDELSGKSYSRYIDPYFETISKQYKLQRIGFTNINDSKINPLYPIDFFSTDNFLIYKNLNKFINKGSDIDMTEYNKMITTFEEINKIVLGEFKIKPFYSGLINQFEEVIAYTAYFDELFKISKVKWVFLECFYDIIKMAMIISGKKYGVKFIEIQHGGAEDNVYLPYHKKTIDYQMLPDYFWCWSESDKDLIIEHNGNFKFLIPFIGGSMWLKKFVSNEINPVTKEEEMFFVRIKEKYKKIILVCLQPVFLLDKVIKETILNETGDFLFLVRFHPHITIKERNEIKNTLGGQTNIETEMASKINLFYLFKNCDVQLTHSSTTAMESLTFNLPTIVCSKYGYDFYKEQIKDGVILFSDNSEEIINIISRENKLNERKSNYYKIRCNEKEAIENLTNLITSCAA